MPEVDPRFEEGAPEDPTTLLVHLNPRSMNSLRRAAQFSGWTQTDTINRALQLYALVMDAVVLGDADILVSDMQRHHPDAEFRIAVIPVGAHRRFRRWRFWRRNKS